MAECPLQTLFGIQDKINFSLKLNLYFFVNRAVINFQVISDRYFKFNIDRLFIDIFWLYMLLIPIFGMLALSGTTLFFSFPKIPALLMVCLFAVHFVTHKVVLFSESILFLCFLPLAATVGFMEHGYTESTLSHVYVTLMPVLALSFGAHFRRRFEISFHKQRSFQKLIQVSFVAYLVIFPVYFWLVHSGRIDYWGLGIAGLIIVALFMLANRNYFKFILTIIITLLSGKRSVLVCILLTSLVPFLPSFHKRTNLRSFLIVGSMILVFSSLFVVAKEYDLLRRFELTAQIDFQDTVSMYKATGGRSQEVFDLIDYMSRNGYWVFGGGFGAQFETHDLSGEAIVRHYSHFTPLAYTLIYGSLFTVSLYILFSMNVIRILKDRKDRSRPFCLIFVALLINSFFGASPLSDPMIWFVLGFVKEKKRMVKSRNAHYVTLDRFPNLINFSTSRHALPKENEG